MSSPEAHREREENTLHYNAFISYKHVSPDLEVARRLHTILENYRIPGKLRESSGIRKIDRIFRDREELNVSADLGKKIEEALLHSDYLILICSPESKASEWVQREVAFFLQHHSPENVLTVLVRGEPETAFPEAICQREEWAEVDGEKKKVLKKVEPLAADVRADSLPETMKLLKEESLRILAGILQCPYDTLKQRHREKRLRGILYSALAVAALALAFMGYALHSRQQINSQYQEARKNLARSLSAKARDEIKEGDRKKAMLLALAVQNEKDPGHPVVPEQVSVLHDAIGTYNIGDRYISEYGPVDGMIYGSVSEDKKSILMIDGFSNLILLDGNTGEPVWKMTHTDFEEQEEEIKANWANTKFVDNDRAFVWNSENLLLMDVKEKKILYHINGEFPTTSDYLAISLRSDRFCFLWQESSGNTYGDFYDSYLKVYQLQTGDQILNHKLELLHTKEERINFSNILYNRQGTNLYVSVSDRKNMNNIPGLIAVSTEDQKIRTISTKECLKAYVTKEDELACFFREKKRNAAGEVQTGDDAGCHLTVYDKKGREQWTSFSFITSDNPDMMEDLLKCDKKYQRVLYGWCRNELLIFNLDERKLMTVFPSYSAIRGACSHKSKDWILISFTNGSVLAVDAMNYSNRQEILSLDNDIRHFYYNKKTDEIVQINSGGSFIFSYRNQDEEMKEVPRESVPDNPKYTFGYTEAGNRSWPYIIEKGETAVDDREITILDPNTRKPLYTFSLEKEGGRCLDSLQFGMQGENFCMAFIMKTDDDRNILYKINVSQQKVLIREEMNKYETLSFYNAVFSNDLSRMVCDRINGGLVVFDLKEGKAIPWDRAIWSKRSIEKFFLSCDGKYLLGESTSQATKEYRKHLYVYNMEKGKYLNKRISYSGEWKARILTGKESHLMAIYDGANHISVFDMETGDERNSFDVEISDSDGIGFEFFDKDRYIITYDKSNVSMWNIASGKRTMSYEYEEGQWVSDTIAVSPGIPYFSLKAEGSVTPFSSGDLSQMSRLELHVFYVDKDHRFYPVCHMKKGAFGVESREVTVLTGWDQIFYSPLYSFDVLRKRALKQLDGKQLSDAEKKEYFVSGE